MSCSKLRAVLAGWLLCVPMFLHGQDKSGATKQPVTPAQVAAPALALDDIKKLQESIGGLLSRYEGQGASLKEIHTELAAIKDRLERNQPVDLEPLRTSIRTLVTGLADLKTAQATNATALDASVKSTDAKLTDLTNLVKELSAKVASLQSLSDEFAKLRTGLAKSGAPSTNAVPSESAAPTTVLVALAVCTAIIVAAVLFFSRRPPDNPAPAFQAAIAQLRDQIAEGLKAIPASSFVPAATPAPAPDQAAAPTADPAIAENLTRLQQIVTRLETLERRADDVPTKQAPSKPLDERTTVPRESPGTAGTPYHALWAPVFLDPASPMSRWRALLESHLGSADHPALPVVSSLLGLRMILASAVHVQHDVAEAVASLSKAVHAYWQSLPDLNEDDRLRASAEWIAGTKQLIAPVAPKLDLREVVPGTRFDPDTMQTVHEGSGNHLNVAEVYSWVVLDRSGDRPKILHRARIATT